MRLLLCCLLLVPFTSQADNIIYWSAGSYSKQASAESEATRIADTLKTETRVHTVLTKAGTRHRVLVKAAQADMKTVLEGVGITGAWRVFIESPASTDLDKSQRAQTTDKATLQAGSRLPPPPQQKTIDTNLAQSNSPAVESKISSLNSHSATPPGSQDEAYFFSSSIIEEARNQGRWRSDIGFEHRTFQNPGLFDLRQNHTSISLQSEYYRTWNDGNDIFAFVPFLRYDAEDKRRTHADIRELTWIHVADNYELRTGIRKVFWGVTESQHLVDIINQTDTVENPDGEEKLGQPMINLSWVRNWGVLDIYWLMGFRERNFSGQYGRPRFPFIIDKRLAVYESSAERYRSDFAVRWVQSLGDLELGLSHFSGTSREPMLVPHITLEDGVPASVTVIPHYNIIDQTGIDAQYFLGDWAFKAEAITRSGQGNRYTAATLGFEKTFVGIAGSRGDLGLIAEYLYDDRGAVGPAMGQDDIAVGLRYAFNDVADTTALLVTLVDRNSHEYLTTLEASGRLGERLKITVEASMFSNTRKVNQSLLGYLDALADPNADLAFLRDEDFIKLELIWYL